MTVDALASILHRPHRGKSYHLWTSSYILFFSVQVNLELASASVRWTEPSRKLEGPRAMIDFFRRIQ